ncbi:hypothetical protein C2S52_006918 [Perilla frutescens var. hirtella]|nr:hypothetical protein C2S51_009064 [Perilla frutescens var. frutescens]KAH6787366.1 hypothetical protein C2S52_006918 [Perilla frutescens var. hirtella]
MLPLNSFSCVHRLLKLPAASLPSVSTTPSSIFAPPPVATSQPPSTPPPPTLAPPFAASPLVSTPPHATPPLDSVIHQSPLTLRYSLSLSLSL